MTAITSNPSSLDFLSKIGFKAEIERLKDTEYMVQRVRIPGPRVSNVMVPNPFGRAPVPGDHPEIGQLTFSFLVNESLSSWTGIRDWLTDISRVDGFDRYAALAALDQSKGLGLSSNIVIYALSSNRLANKRLMFHGCVPSALSDLELNSVDRDVDYMIATATFDFVNLTIEEP